MKNLLLLLSLIVAIPALGARTGDYDFNDGGSLPRQYIKNGNATANVAGWATYADAAGTMPVDGTGGSPSITWTRTTTTPLSGSGSFVLTKGATNRQGDGVCYAFTIDAADKTAPSTARFSYIVTSGTYVSGDLAFFIIDTTTGEVKQPSASSIANIVGESRSPPMEFQLNPGLTYRACIHVASTSASAYTVKFGRIQVQPKTYSTGAFTSPTTPYTPTTAGFGSPSGISFNYRRNADYLFVEGTFVTGTVSGSTAQIGLPSGLSIDFTKVASTQVVGKFWQGTASSSVNKTGTVIAISGTSSTAVEISIDNPATAQSPVSPLAGNAWTLSTTSLYFQFQVPIVGWGSSQVLSTETDGRIVAAKYYSVVSATASTSAPIQWNTKDYDTHNAVTTGSSWNFKVPIPGKYRVTATANNSTGSSNMILYKNGSAVNGAELGLFSGSTSGGTTTTDCVANDLLDVRSESSVMVSSDSKQNITIERISGASQVASAERVYLQYTTNAGGSVTANVTNIDWTTKFSDSHASWNGTTFTSPRPSWYTITGAAKFTTASTRGIEAYVNGVQRIRCSGDGSQGSASMACGIFLNQGDLLTFRTDTTSTLSASAVLHTLNISSQEGGPGSAPPPPPRVEAARVTAACALTNKTDGITAISGSNADCTLTFTPAFSVPPACSCSAEIVGTSGVMCSIRSVSAGSVNATAHVSGQNTGSADPFAVTCMEIK